jgi:GNAT superfamily N-acetyltransferase
MGGGMLVLHAGGSMLNIREATANDNAQLQELQVKCPQGRALSVSVVNTPDFFARARVYESYKVFVACEGDRIIGSAACALRKGIVNGQTRLVGYEFQGFTAPGYRKKGIAKRLLQHIEKELTQNGAALLYSLIMEGNLPPMKLVEALGFKRDRTIVMTIISVFKEMPIPPPGTIRALAYEDLNPVAELLNKTWQGNDLYEPRSGEGLARFIERTPAYGFDNVMVLEDQGEILACLGFWDWSQIARITVKSLNLKMRITGLLVDISGHFRATPRVPKAGTILKQWCLTPIGFKDPEHLAPLMRYLNNEALNRGIEQIFCMCERKHPLLWSMEGLFCRDVAMHVYVKPYSEDVSLGENPVFIDGIDL